MPAPLALTGQRFGHLTALDRAGKDQFHAWMWRCRCDCGAETVVRGSTLTAGRTSACASCATRESNTTHGKSDSALYRRWRAMKARCTNPNTKHYPDYGGRGIRVCGRWLHSFENFVADMGSTFEPELWIDRIDVDGNYEPSNCRWATPLAQQRNKRNNHVLSFEGRSMTVTDWADEIGVKPNTLIYRLRRGWTLDRALDIANMEVPDEV